MVGVEAGGLGIRSGMHAARFSGGSIGILQGTKTFLLQDDDGQIQLTHSVSAGLDYAAVGPEHSLLRDLGRAEYSWVSDDDAIRAFDACCRWEGILPALETSHAIAFVMQNATAFKKDDLILLNLSGRGDKDVQQVSAWKAEHNKNGEKS